MKRASMSSDKSESLKFYKYLCQKIGSEEVVRIRRLAFTINDIGKIDKRITSGSKGEGLEFKDSDIDIMYIDRDYKVYESGTKFKDVFFKTITLIVNTEETQPCYAQLCLLNGPYLMLSNMYMEYVNLAHRNHLGYMLSSEQFIMNKLNAAVDQFRSSLSLKIHGPCLSDKNDKLDMANCLKCDTWISQAKPWVSRPRSTWPPPELISKIVSCGVLFVPIGCKGSINAHIEWRVSFSIAEKILVFSFSHTQLLCYAMLKVLMKEIVEKHEDLKGLLCSYFLKTLMFWISEEMDPYIWRPDNMIPCVMACLQRLLYCVRYSTLSHYFIPDNNLLGLRFNITNKEKLITILKNIYEQGINCFASSETLRDYQSLSYEVTESAIIGNITILQQLLPTFSIIKFSDGSSGSVSRLLYEFLHHSRTSVSKGLFALQLSNAFMFVPEETEYQYRSGNKHHYFKYKHDLSQLVIGLHADAVSGLLMLASFFYVHEQYLFSLIVIKYALQKYTDEKIFAGILNQTFNHIQNYVVNLMKKEKLYTIVKSLLIHHIRFNRNSSLVPQELQLDVTEYYIILHPLQFAHFIRFLCYYHLHEIQLCSQTLQQLKHSTNSERGTAIYPCFLNEVIICGIAHQLFGDTSFAREAFQTAALFDKDKLTSAASRLSSLNK